MQRSRILFTAPIILAVVLIGVFAIRSRGSDDTNIESTERRTCEPIARADAAATKPLTPVAIDVLANDTDPDNDTLVFQVLQVTGGDYTIDDGGTPTDAGDDRIVFTPADPAPEKGLIEYQAVDPDGAIGESIVNVYINAEGVLPPGIQSDPISGGGDGTGDCAITPNETTSTIETGPTTSSAVTTTSVVEEDLETTPTTRRSTTGTTQRRSTTTTKKNTTTTKKPTETTQPPSTTPPTNPPTTKPPTTSPPTTNQCGAYPVNGTEEEQTEWENCIRGGN